MPDFPIDYVLNNASYSIDNSITTMVPKSREILSKVIYDRITFLQSTITEIEFLLVERHKLKNKLSFDIDQDVCDARTQLYRNDILPDASRQSMLEKQILELHKEKRQQQLAHWQDATKLKHERRKAEKELQSAMLDLWMIRFLS